MSNTIINKPPAAKAGSGNIFRLMLVVMMVIAGAVGASDFEPDDDEEWSDIPAARESKKVVGFVITVDFPDMRTKVTQAEVDEFFNRKGGVDGARMSGSVYDWFYEASNGLLEYTNIVAPIITLPRPRSYYDSLVAVAGTKQRDALVRPLITDALNALSGMKINLKGITLDAQGSPVAVNIFYAGSRLCLDHAGSYKDKKTKLNGMEIRKYQITAMGTDAFEQRLGTVVHENAHMLMNWPDLYDPIRDRRRDPVGRWCVMAVSGGAYPGPPNTYFKYLAGWIDAVHINDIAPGTVLSLEANSSKAYVYWRNMREAYFIEALRSNDARNRIPGSGLAIWHIHSEGRRGVQRIPLVRLIQADGKNDLEQGVNRGDSTDLFRAGVNSEFHSASTPAAIYHDGSPSGICIKNISDSGAVMTFTVCDDYAHVKTQAYRFDSRMAGYATASQNFVVEVGENFTLNNLVPIPAPARKPGATLTIRGANPASPATITRGDARGARGDLFTIADGATLVLENIIIDGGNLANSNGALVKIDYGGTLVMNSGAVLRNNVNSSQQGKGGAVWAHGGTLTISGGEISGNTARRGGGVYFAGNVTARGGKKYVTAFTMNGGKISGNSAAKGGGGGVSVEGGSFTMQGGEISGNSATENGGGVNIWGAKNFTLANGKITGNTAAKNGGGVDVQRMPFTMNGGEISGNKAGSNGGGVNAVHSAVTMTGGAITANTAAAAGGGAHISIVDFTMTGGRITGNTASRDAQLNRAGGKKVNLTGGVVD